MAPVDRRPKTDGGWQKDEDGRTLRERQVIALMADDPEISQAEIGRRLGISKQAAGVIVRRLRKLGVIW